MEYYLAADYTVDNFHIRVKRPVLTPEEAARRDKEIYNAAVALMKSVYAAQKKKETAQ